MPPGVAANATCGGRASAAPRLPYTLIVSWRAAISCLILAAAFSAARAAEIQLQQGYTWPDQAGIRWRLQQGDLLVVSRCGLYAGPAGLPAAEGPVLGVSLPWLRCGPLLPRGILRQVSDPLGFSAWSSAIQERTTLVLDGELSSSGQGMLLMPVPELFGLFCRPVRAGGSEYGAFGCLPLGAGAAAEGAIMVSRPEPQVPPDDWFLTRSIFPGGDVTDLCARLVLNTPSLGFSFTSGISSAARAAPGAFSNLWMSGRFRGLLAAVLLAGATPGFRGPDGTCTTGASQLSAMVRLGNDRRTGTLETGWSYSVGRPTFAPGPEIPTRTVLRVELSRDFERQSCPPLSLVMDAEKDISRSETSRCGSAAWVRLDGMDVTAGVSLSHQEGVRLLGAVSIKPSSRLRILVEGRANRLAAASPDGSMTVKVSFERGSQRAAIQAGFENVPLPWRSTHLAECFRLSLTSSLRVMPQGEGAINPSLRQG